MFGHVGDYQYLCIMRKDEIVDLLKQQINSYKKLIDDLREQEKRQSRQITELIAEVASLREALLQKDESLSKQKRVCKGLGKLISATSEKQLPRVTPLTDEERREQEEERSAQRKARKNNGSKRDMHADMEVEEHDIYPEEPEFDMDKARPLSEKLRISIRYECVPMRFIKHVYKIHSYTQDGRVYTGQTPSSAFLNSNYDASFIAGLMELRYIQSIPVERIIGYFESHGFTLKKPTAHKLIERASVLLENLYKCTGQTVLQDNYISADETYYKILVSPKNSKGRGVRKGYLWVIIGMRSKLMYVLYEDGSRSEDVILRELEDYRGIIQSDGYSPYRKLQKEDYPHITRIACLQHVKRKFIDCGEDEEAKKMVCLIGKLYHQEHKHRIGEKEWTEEKNRRFRNAYAPPILEEIRAHLARIESDPDLPPKSGLYTAAVYMRNEWDAIENIFKHGATSLDNNTVERMNRYFSISRRNSLFFGSHKGAERGAILYTLALSCRMNGINLFQYLTDIINRTALWQPNTDLEKYRELLPDRYKNNA